MYRLSLLALLAGCSGEVVVEGESTVPGTVPGDSPSDTPSTEEETTVEGVTGDGEPEKLSVVATPPGGTFSDPLEIVVTAEGAVELRYTLDGSLPDGDSNLYQAPLAVNGSATLRVMATNEAGEVEYLAQSYLRVEEEVEEASSNLPLVVLYSDDSLPEGEEDYVSISLQIHDVGDDGRAHLLGEASDSHRAGLRVRGSSTATDPKHSYALEIRGVADDEDNNEPLLDLPSDSDWVLYAPLGFDRALMRNALVYRLSNDAGRYAPRTRFVEVYESQRGQAIDADDYVGVYALMERISRSTDRVNVVPLTAEDVAEPEVTGGYIFKRDRVGTGEDGFWAGTAGGSFSFSDPLVNVYPKEEEIPRAQAIYLEKAVDAFADALSQPDGVNPETGQHYSELIDVDAFIDHHILNMFPKNPDALRLSGYLYKDREGPVVAGPVWDFDRAMYCADDTRADDPTWWDNTNETTDTTPMFTYGWYTALFDDPTFTAAYWARWSELLDGALSVEHVHGVIDEMAAELEEAAPRNFARWSDYPPRGGSFDTEVQLLKDWTEERHDWIAACIADHPEDPERCTGD